MLQPKPFQSLTMYVCLFSLHRVLYSVTEINNNKGTREEETSWVSFNSVANGKVNVLLTLYSLQWHFCFLP